MLARRSTLAPMKTPKELPHPDAATHTSARFIDETELRNSVPVSRKTLFGWRRDGKIPFVRVAGGRRVLYHLPSVERALLKMQRGAGD